MYTQKSKEHQYIFPRHNQCKNTDKQVIKLIQKWDNNTLSNQESEKLKYAAVERNVISSDDMLTEDNVTDLLLMCGWRPY